MEKWQAMFAPTGLDDALQKLRFELSRSNQVQAALEDYLFVQWAVLLKKARLAQGEERLYWLTMAESLAELSGNVLGITMDKPTTDMRGMRV